MASSDAFFEDPERFRALFAQAPVGAFIVDFDHRIRDFNDAFVTLLHSAPERLRMLDVRKLRDQRVLPAILAALAGEESTYLGPYDPTTADSHLIVAMRCRPIVDAHGQPCGAFCSFDDATDRVRLELELRQQHALVEEQTQTIRALQTPILEIWPRVLCLPVIGGVDHARATEMTETMLRAVESNRARFVLVDLTGVEIADTATAQHIVRMFHAAALVGAEVVVCGIQPAIAQTMIGLGIDLQMRTERTLHKALEHCLKRLEGRAAG